MGTTDIDTYLTFVLKELLKKQKFYYNTFVAEPDQELTELFQALFSRSFTARLQAMQAQGRTIQGPVSIVSAFYVGGIVCSIIQWIKNDFDISIEEMVQCQKNLLADLAE
jgi:hypothetical protein